jgi:glycosyltransferase involved in cell wall biosynthesis
LIAHVPYWAPPLRSDVPVVVTVHDLIPLVLSSYRRKASGRAYTRLVARATKNAAAVLADSEATARDIREHLGIPNERIHVVHLGVHDSFRPADEAEVTALRQRLELPTRYGLYLGGYELRKNLLTLLRAWRMVYAKTGAKLVLGGRLPDGSHATFPDPRAIARAEGLPAQALVETGFVADEDLATLYSGASVFAFPSIYEGFGLPPLEAMACGAPAVVANATSLPEMVGEAGRLVAPEDPAAWAEAIAEVLEDEALAARMREEGLVQAAGFTWAETARRTRGVYRGVLGRRRPNAADADRVHSETCRSTSNLASGAPSTTSGG